jgi:hypothetical protein
MTTANTACIASRRVMPSQRRIWWHATVSVLALLAACGTPTDTGPSPLILARRYTYSAVTPTNAALQTTGTLALDPQQGRAFGGTGLLTVRDLGTGQIQQLAVGLAGTVIDSTTIDFELASGSDVRRRHLGRVRGDSISGTWSESSTTGTAATGQFVLHVAP